jgi:hypothetical protein
VIVFVVIVFVVIVYVGRCGRGDVSERVVVIERLVGMNKLLFAELVHGGHSCSMYRLRKRQSRIYTKRNCKPS